MGTRSTYPHGGGTSDADAALIRAMLALLIYKSGIIYAQSKAYPGYDERYDPLIGGIQIEIATSSNVSAGKCSLAFPVQIIDGGRRVNGFITAGHCINIAKGENFVHQPVIGQFWYTFIGMGTRSTYPHGGGTSDADAALIRLEICERFGCFPTRGIAPYIFENGEYYPPGQSPDSDNKVIITEYVNPSHDYIGWITCKSGRRTGLTYGYLTKINDVAILEDGKVIISPVLKIERCYRSQQCYRGEWFAWFGDSGGSVYFRLPYGSGHYQARVIGLVTGSLDPWTYFWATWATKVCNRWSDVTCLRG
jgi:hypothetical protein